MYIIVELLLVNLSLVAAFFLVYDRDLPTFLSASPDYLSTMPLTIGAVLYIDYFGMTHFFERIARYGHRLVSFCVSGHCIAAAMHSHSMVHSGWVMVVGSGIMFISTSIWTVACLK